MPTFGHTETHDGRRGGEVAACMHIRPRDPMKLDTDSMKTFKVPTRATPVGGIDPYGDRPQAGDPGHRLLFTESGAVPPTF